MDEAILLNYLKGQTNKEECLQVESWSDASPDNRKILEELYCVLFIGDRLTAMEQIDVEASLAKLKADIKRKTAEPKKMYPKWRRYVAVAAAFLAGIIFTGAILWGLLENKSSYVFLTEKGERAQVVLPDGTKVWLNSSTRLSYSPSLLGFDRKLDLTGEAYFEVAHNKRKPFIVNIDNIKAVVLGTKFNIRARNDEHRVVTTLLKGSVRVDVDTPGEKDKGFLLRPGQELSINTQTYDSKLIESLKPDDILLWIKGKLTFRNSTLVDIANSLEKHFDVQFVFDNEELQNKRFTGEFNTDDDITQILTVLSLTNQVNFKKDGRDVILSD